ncbi:MAG TPA: alpha/beta hydrolase fold domain-containing protein [Acidimicrobiia bacterium]|nr:alpha/beta hydrolase fold domain-containing protein [Acidimicrobiia bacterium]
MGRSPILRRWTRLALLVAVSLTTACAPESAPTTTTTATATTTTAPSPTTAPGPDRPVVEVHTEEYLPGLAATVFSPVPPGAGVLVMVPGGGWQTADPAGFADLARYLAETGLVVVTVEVRAAVDDVVYPVPVEDVMCAVGFSAEWAEAQGQPSGPLVVLGHSTGAHLAALAALAGPDELPECSPPALLPDALVGLAGTYDVAHLPEVAVSLFGVPPEEDPDLWDRGNPVMRAGARPEVPVLLIHGAEDELVPRSFTDEFASALDSAGHRTTVEIIPAADHHQIYRPESTGSLIGDWAHSLAGLPSE